MVFLVSYEVRRDGAIGTYQWETVSVLADSVRDARTKALEMIVERLGWPGQIDTRGSCIEGENVRQIR